VEDLRLEMYVLRILLYVVTAFGSLVDGEIGNSTGIGNPDIKVHSNFKNIVFVYVSMHLSLLKGTRICPILKCSVLYRQF
jgi:hypothetical protein